MCKGHVYYGSYEMDGYKSPIDFWTMTSDYFTVNQANNTQNVTCNATSFEDTDPNPGKPKQCYCDDEMLQQDETNIQYIKEYWRGIMYERWAEQARAQAEAEAEAARAQAEADALAE